MATNKILNINEIYEDTNGAKPCCVKLPEGTMIVWGETPVTTNTSGGKPYAYRANVEVNVPFFNDFTDDPLSAFACATTGYPENCNGGITNLSKTYFRVGLGSNSNNDTKTVKWCVFGRWRDFDTIEAPFSYSGTNVYTQEAGSAWTCILTGDGTLTVTEPMAVDLYLLGGGQGGYKGETTTYGGYDGTFYVGGAGGQGGFISTVYNVTLQAGTYSVTIGQGGSEGNGVAGGTTYFGNIASAPGGGSGADTSIYQGGAAGGAAGSMHGSNVPYEGGTGANSTVADFNGVYRGGGGGGGYSYRYNNASGSTSYNWASTSGSEEGGGRSWPSYSSGRRYAVENYGGGGYGAAGNNNGSYGSSGVVIIRSHR